MEPEVDILLGVRTMEELRKLQETGWHVTPNGHLEVMRRVDVAQIDAELRDYYLYVACMHGAVDLVEKFGKGLEDREQLLDGYSIFVSRAEVDEVAEFVLLLRKYVDLHDLHGMVRELVLLRPDMRQPLIDGLKRLDVTLLPLFADVLGC